jgi:hypothetical protein
MTTAPLPDKHFYENLLFAPVAIEAAQTLGVSP